MPATANTIGGASTATTAPLPVANSIDPVQDLTPIYTASATATQAINRNVYLGLSNPPVGTLDSQTVGNKTFSNSNAYTAKDGSFTLQNSSDVTKQANFSLAGNTTSTTRTYTLPNASVTLSSLTGTEILTNKTLTSPTINAPIITNASITADTYAGFTTSNTGSIYGISVTTGKITTANSIGTGTIVQNGVAASQLATNAITLGYAQITTPTAALNNDDPVGLSVTVTIPGGGRRVRVSAFTQGIVGSISSNQYGLSIWDGTVGSGTQLANTEATAHANNAVVPSSPVAVVTPAAGSKTYNVGLHTDGGTGTVEAASTAPCFLLVEAI